MFVEGLILAAGAGTRYGQPKALAVDHRGESWLARAVATLREGGCDRVTVVLGAEFEAAERVALKAKADAIVEAPDWASGMGRSLSAGLNSLRASVAIGVVIFLVDLPDIGGQVVRRILAPPLSTGMLLCATYDGNPGHPVFAGRDHWARIGLGAHRDTGAKAYLESHGAVLVECGDLATGKDRDYR